MTWTQLLDISLHIDQHLGGLILQYGAAVYALLFAIVFCEIAFLPLFFLPGNPLIMLCGAFCARGLLSLPVMIPLLFAAVVLGSLVNYRIGRKLGYTLLAKDHAWLDRSALQKAHAFYESRGGVTFLISPFLGMIRTLAPFVAGMSAMTPRRFVLYVAGGGALWSGSLVTAGYFFGNAPFLRDHMGTLTILGVALGLGALVVSSGWRLIKTRLR
ncbi:membrane-associated protein [Silvimonas terrae]|uniref:Membrane-associated protein n=1 Tax=Silvimonas terrae TaxID=300266 RepID=A0A840RBT7_9NEIS|nr:VTT domain-containing protein [Silvimonas terrae]MBB5189792.1 membrane-associated protein [Silvimonas terrae]